MKTRMVFVLLLLILVLPARAALAHCEIPCGIYDDRMRVALIREHIDTIEKSMKMIDHLTGEADKNYNQIVRWINNKEAHAEELQHVVYQYFMTQRIKSVDKGKDGFDSYIHQLTLLHELLLEAMKSKQTVELDHVDSMRKLADKFEKAYFKEE